MRPNRALALGAAFLGVAVQAGAIPLALSVTDMTWTTPAGDGPSSTLAVHLEDLADPRPDVGQIRMTLRGQVEQDFDSDPFSYVWRVVLGIFPQDNDSLLRPSPVDPFESTPFVTDAFNTWEDVIGEVDPDFAAVVYDVDADRIGRIDRDWDPRWDWHSTVILTVLNFGPGDTKTLRFLNNFRIAECTVPTNCVIGPETIAGETDVQVTAIPEPGTALLVALGILGLAGWRRESRG